MGRQAHPPNEAISQGLIQRRDDCAAYDRDPEAFRGVPMQQLRRGLGIDAGPLVSLLDATDADHARCTELLQETSERRMVPVLVLVEVEYLLRPWPEAFAALLAEFAAGGFELLELPKQWLLRTGELLQRYRDLSLGLVDASVVAATEMLGETKLATLDHGRFSAVRPAHTDGLILLP